MKTVTPAAALGATCIALHLSNSNHQVQGFVISAGAIRASPRSTPSSLVGRDFLPSGRLAGKPTPKGCATCRMAAEKGGGGESKFKGVGVSTVRPVPGKGNKRSKNSSPSSGGAVVPPPVENGSPGNRNLLLQFQCNVCEKYSQYMIGKGAYETGIVICTCKGCGVRHLISDNLKKMDFPEFGNNIEDFMKAKGSPEEVTRGTAPNFSPEILEKYDLRVGDDGLLVLRPKVEDEESAEGS